MKQLNRKLWVRFGMLVSLWFDLMGIYFLWHFHVHVFQWQALASVHGWSIFYKALKASFERTLYIYVTRVTFNKICLKYVHRIKHTLSLSLHFYFIPLCAKFHVNIIYYVIYFMKLLKFYILHLVPAHKLWGM